MGKYTPHYLLDAPMMEDTGGSLKSGVLYAANEARFDAATFSEPMTAYAIGFRDPENLDGLLERIAPAIRNMPRKFEFKKNGSDFEFLSEGDDIRAIGANFKQLQTTGESVMAKTLNKGLMMRVDHDEVTGTEWKQQTVGYLKRRLIRNDLRRAIAGLVSVAKNTAVTWKTDGSSLPDKDLRKTLRKTRSANGLRATHLLFGGEAWEYRIDSYESHDKRAAAADKTPEQVASSLNLNHVIVSEAVYTVGKGLKADIVHNIALAYNARSGIMKDDPSNIKRFQTATDAGDFKVYIIEHAKFTDVIVEHYSNIIITVDKGIEMLTITQA